MRSICREFKVRLNWLQGIARVLWVPAPKNLGLTENHIDQIKTLQVFGIKADEMWSFVGMKKNKRWIWIAYAPIHRKVIAQYIGK